MMQRIVVQNQEQCRRRVPVPAVNRWVDPDVNINLLEKETWEEWVCVKTGWDG